MGGIVDVGCHGGKKGPNAFFAWSSACCDPKNIGFSDNIPMFKMQITAMPVYKNSGTNGRFKANRGAGSVCTMVSPSPPVCLPVTMVASKHLNLTVRGNYFLAN